MSVLNMSNISLNSSVVEQLIRSIPAEESSKAFKTLQAFADYPGSVIAASLSLALLSPAYPLAGATVFALFVTVPLISKTLVLLTSESNPDEKHVHQVAKKIDAIVSFAAKAANLAIAVMLFSPWHLSLNAAFQGAQIAVLACGLIGDGSAALGNPIFK